ncbi:MAG: tripartite tricarboxylate transporter permease [Deltaproteobacteria bacterium]|nr:tripartite tricarboxylate transporter permease [Deltaproteobacteria bacterium]
MENFFIGLQNALSLHNLLYCFIGCLLGTVVGVLPGLGPTATMAMLLPLTAYLDPTGAIIMLAGIFYGAMYGGSVTSILLNVPGEASSILTCIDGYQMTKQGRGGEALAIAAIGSFIAGTLAIVVLQLCAPPLADLGLKFGAPEYVSLMLFCFTTLVAVSGKSKLRGVLMAALGMVIASIGLDPMTGRARLIFGFTDLMKGFDVIPVLMGLFGMAEILSSANEGLVSIYKGELGSMIPRGAELAKGLYASLRGTAVGLGLGVLPGMMPSVISFVAYDVERRSSKHPEKFGTGAIEGVASVEASNNAASEAGLIPLLSLGLPTNAACALLFASFTMYGLQPGPLLFSQHGDMAWTIIVSMYVGNVILVILNLPLVGVWVRLAMIPYRYLGPVTLAICIIGAYSVRNTLFDVWTAIAFGILGYVMKMRDWPAAPLILGFILGPALEQHFRATLQMSGGSLAIFVDRPIAILFLVMTAIVLIFSFRPSVVQNFKKFG